MTTESTRSFPERAGSTASALIAISGFVALIVLGLAIARFHAGLSAVQLGVFYALPALWVLVSVAALRSGAEVRIGFVLLQFSCVAAVMASDIGASVWLEMRARVVGRPTLRAQLTQIRGTGIDAFPRIPVNQIVDLEPRIRVGASIEHAIAPGPAQTTILLCSEDRPMLTYRCDRYGFDNLDSVWDAPSVDLAIIGDSYAVGVCVPSEDAIPGQLRTRGTVLNLGVSGAGSLQELALLGEYAARWRRRAVVCIFCEGNDHWDIRREEKRGWLTAYLGGAHSQELSSHHVEVDSGSRLWIDSLVGREPLTRPVAALWNVGEILRLRSLRRLIPVESAFPGSGKSIGVLPEVSGRARSDIASCGGQFIFVYMPAYVRYGTWIGEPCPSRIEMLRLLGERGIATADLHETFGRTADPRSLWVTPSSHLTAEGYRLSVEAIARALDFRRFPRP